MGYQSQAQSMVVVGPANQSMCKPTSYVRASYAGASYAGANYISVDPPSRTPTRPRLVDQRHHSGALWYFGTMSP
eukprot:237200-Rhodomonas_salina.1